MRSILEYLGKGRVGMDHLFQFGDCRALRHQRRRFLDDIGTMRTEHMAAENLSGGALLVGNHNLAVAFRLIHAQSLAVRTVE